MRQVFKRCALALVFAATAVTTHAIAQQAATAAAKPALRPASAASVEDYVKRSQFNTYLVSPDGTKLASLVPINNRENLVVIDLEKRTRTNITSFDAYDVSDVSWITNERVFFRTVERRDIGARAKYQGSYAINIDGSGVKNIDSFRGTPAGSRFIGVMNRQTGDILIEAYLRRREAVDAYKVNTASGTIELLTFDSPADTTQFLYDSKFVARFAWAGERKNTRDVDLWYRADASAKWEKIQTFREGGEYWEPVQFSSDDKRMIVRSNVGRDKKALYWYDVATRAQQELIYEHPLIDIGEAADYANNARGDGNPNPLLFLSDPNKPDDPAKLVGIRIDADKQIVKWFDPALDALQKQIDAALPGRFNAFPPAAMLGRKVLVRSTSPNAVTRNYMFDATKKTLEDLPISQPTLADVALPERTYFPYNARDQLPIPAFLTLPRDSAGKKLPLIVHIHGGPYLRDYSSLPTRSESRFLASRGYAVLEPEPRGSKGFGRKHFTAGWGTWGASMQDDITDGVKALVDKGIVDPNRVCLYGGSYGGYATLQGLVREPDMFKCGLATVAVTDLELFQDTTWSDIPVQYKSMQEWFAERVGDPKRDAERLQTYSPLRNANKIKAPVLLMMGEADVRVPLVHGNKMRDAMKSAGVPHDYHIYVGEGHGWNKDENRVDFHKRAEAFFEKHLKPGS
jgi:dipeptidyl aminopeptidase/acylaminoacyl peptidase